MEVSWRREHIRSPEDYDQIETYRVLRDLVEKYCMNKDNSTLRKAADFLFSHKTDEGDFRGICGRQYVPYYSAAIMELLIKSGYSEDSRIRRGFKWLVSIRQHDGGWFDISTCHTSGCNEPCTLQNLQRSRGKRPGGRAGPHFHRQWIRYEERNLRHLGPLLNRYGNLLAFEEINRKSRKVMVKTKRARPERGYEIICTVVASVFPMKPGATEQEYQEMAMQLAKETGLPASLQHPTPCVKFN